MPIRIIWTHIPPLRLIVIQFMFRLYTIFWFCCSNFYCNIPRSRWTCFSTRTSHINIMQHIKSTTNSRNEAYSDYPTTASYDELAKQIRNAEGVVNSEIRVKANPNGNGYSTAARLLILIATSRGWCSWSNRKLGRKSSCRFRCSHGDQVSIRKNLREIGDFYIVHKLPFIPIPLQNYNLIFNVF